MTSQDEAKEVRRLFINTLPAVPPPMSELLESYSGVPKDEQIQHITRFRDKAYARHPYPCLGRFRFLDMDLSTNPMYSKVLELLKQPSDSSSGDSEPLFVDLGCCVGQDVRKLVFDGAPVSRVYGAELLPEFVDVGFELFRDEQKLPRDHFLAPANVVEDTPGDPLNKLDGRVTVVHASAVFHLFQREQQEVLARRILRLLNRKVGKCLVLGADVGNVDSGRYQGRNGASRWRNNAASWTELWEGAAKDAGDCSVDVTMDLRENDITARIGGEEDRQMLERYYLQEGFRWAVWSVWVTFT